MDSHNPSDDRDPILQFTFKELTQLSSREYQLLKMQQTAYRIEKRETKRRERNSKFERPEGSSTDRYEADRRRAKQARMTDLADRAAIIFTKHENEGDE